MPVEKEHQALVAVAEVHFLIAAALLDLRLVAVGADIALSRDLEGSTGVLVVLLLLVGVVAGAEEAGRAADGLPRE